MEMGGKCPRFDVATISKIYIAINMLRYRTYIKKTIKLLLKDIKQEMNKWKDAPHSRIQGLKITISS